MRVAVLGCGAIGGLFLSRLSSSLNVWAVARPYQVEALGQKGLILKSGQKETKIKVKVTAKLGEPVDLAIFATKTHNLEAAVENNKSFLKKAIVLSTQNGLRAESILNKFFPEEKIISSIVMSGATFYPPNKVISNFDGSLVLGSIFKGNSLNLKKVTDSLGSFFPVEESKNIKGAKHLKLFVNLNNCLPAILGKSMQESFSDIDVCRLAIELNKEAYRIIVKEAGVSLESLPGYPKERIEKLVEGPSLQSAPIFSQIMSGLSKEPLYGSLLQSIKRGRACEIDYLNGEVVCLAKKKGKAAPLNKRIVELVHRVEKEGFLSKKELIKETTPLILS